MAFLRAVTVPEPQTVIPGRTVYLRSPTMNDYPAWSALRAESRAFLTPWEPIWSPDDLTRGSFKRRVRRYMKDAREDLGYAFLLFRAADHVLLGGLSLAYVRRGVAQACSLGYWMGEAFAGQGYMTEGVRTVLPFAFANLRLHRVEAACLPNNAASIRLLEKAGFRREGYARRYLCINGAWRDHLLFARLAEDAESSAERPDLSSGTV